jgi:hypothetical protein
MKVEFTFMIQKQGNNRRGVCSWAELVMSLWRDCLDMKLTVAAK